MKNATPGPTGGALGLHKFTPEGPGPMGCVLEPPGAPGDEFPKFYQKVWRERPFGHIKFLSELEIFIFSKIFKVFTKKSVLGLFFHPLGPVGTPKGPKAPGPFLSRRGKTLKPLSRKIRFSKLIPIGTTNNPPGQYVDLGPPMG